MVVAPELTCQGSILAFVGGAIPRPKPGQHLGIVGSDGQRSKRSLIGGTLQRGVAPLALPLSDAGFDPSVLSEFRTRLVDGNAEYLLFDTLLTQFREQKLLRARGRQRSDSTHVLAAVRALNRLECVGSTLRHALNSLAVVVPDWLLTHKQPEWLERYEQRFEDERLPEAASERTALATEVGRDGSSLLTAVIAADAPDWLRHIPAIETLRQVWLQNYTGTEQGSLRWRTNEETPLLKLSKRHNLILSGNCQRIKMYYVFKYELNSIFNCYIYSTCATPLICPL
ncbi:MAG: hypothetical protein AB4911_13740 [Oscillochloridaceae bacterium umkhey_bin13]